MDNILRVDVKMCFETVEQADACKKILKKYLDSEGTIFSIRRSKADVSMLVNIDNDKDWDNISAKDLEMLNPDYLKLENFSKRDRDKFTELSMNLKRITANIVINVEL